MDKGRKKENKRREKMREKRNMRKIKNKKKWEGICHTRFPERNQMHLICVPGSSSTHMIDKMSVIS
jgi:hypothetical protein